MALSVLSAVSCPVTDLWPRGPAVAWLGGAPLLWVVNMTFLSDVLGFWMSWVSGFFSFDLFVFFWMVFFLAFIWSFIRRLMHLS